MRVVKPCPIAPPFSVRTMPLGFVLPEPIGECARALRARVGAMTVGRAVEGDPAGRSVSTGGAEGGYEGLRTPCGSREADNECDGECSRKFATSMYNKFRRRLFVVFF
ncbi:hypothetical protein KM043_000464 [Ampulex compressa]|nr:hypothetical protein KM043_000464 [Ampulex compressa]